MKLVPYSEYKDSGVPWLGRIPVHWEVRRAKALLNWVDVRSKTGKETLLTVSSSKGIVPRDSVQVYMFKAASYVGYKLCEPGDVVINSLWAWMGGFGVTRYHGLVSTAYSVFRAFNDSKITHAYLDALLRSGAYDWWFRVFSKGIWKSRYQLNDHDFLMFQIMLPPIKEKTQIARFLDGKTAQTDKFIRNKKRALSINKCNFI